MKLSALLDTLSHKEVWAFRDCDISGIVYDPLRLEPGNLFAAIRIYTQLNKVEVADGHALISDAVQKEAGALLLETPPTDGTPDIPIILVPNAREALARVSCAFYHHPSRRLRMVAITGTNGKTTVTHLVESIFNLVDPIGIIGTLYARWPQSLITSKDTTPEPPDLQQLLMRMADSGVSRCALEATSHGVEFFRMEGIEFQVAAFTNLTPDHLDFHGSMDAYKAAKLKIFQRLPSTSTAVINMDDPFGPEFAGATRAGILKVGLHAGNDITALNLEASLDGTRLQLQTPSGTVDVKSPLIGRHNVSNALVAAGIAYAESIDLEVIQQGLSRPVHIPGRFEAVPNTHGFSVVVDYAHTPDAFQNILTLARHLKPGRIITLFGCGGDRDRTKRPEMAAIAETYSDFVVVTSDNPRHEDPARILNDIQAGFKGTAYHMIDDRKTAIQAAISEARPGDLVLLLGKGHEETQTIGEKAIPFSDKAVALDALQQLA